MKLITVLGLLFFIGTSKALELTDKNVNMYQEITKKFEQPRSFDPTYYPSSLITGRCYAKNSRIAKGGALVINTVIQDDGPLGGGGNIVSIGNVATNPASSYFDNMTFQDYASTWNAKFTEFEQLINYDYILSGEENFIYRFAADPNGVYVYAIRTLRDESYPYNPSEACYFFKDNQ